MSNELKNLVDIDSIRFEDKEIEVKINPFTAPSGEPDPEELCKALYPILENSEKMLKEFTKVYRMTEDMPQILEAKKIEYIPTVTEAPENVEAFSLKNPRGPLKVKYDRRGKSSYIDRIWLSFDDVKFLLKNKKKVQTIFNDLILNMFKNLIDVKKLSKDKLYYGNCVATIQMPGENVRFAYANEQDYIEIRLFSDITDVEE